MTEKVHDIAYLIFCLGLMGFVLSLYFQLIGNTLLSLLILAIAGSMFVKSGIELVGGYFGGMDEPDH